MRTLVAAAVACSVLVSLSRAQTSNAAIRKSEAIAPQDLSSALQKFAQNRQLYVIYAQEDVLNQHTGGASGDKSQVDALQELLQGTQLTSRWLDPKTVTVIPLALASSGVEPGLLRLAENGQDVANGTHSTSVRGSEGEGLKVEEVVVTAQKRQERLQDVPISISVVSADEISQRGLVGSGDYLRGMPGVNQVENTYGGQAIVIRGLETTTGNQNFGSGPTVGTYFGETPTTNSAGLLGSAVDLKLVDIERVEVLRGPQGTAFGSSSMGGTVRVIPAAPRTDRVEGSWAGNYSVTSRDGSDNYSFQGALNVPLIADKFAMRAVAYRFVTSGYYNNRAGSNPDFQSQFVNRWGVQSFAADQNGIGDTRFTGGRIAALYQATDDLRVTLSYIKQKSETDGFPTATTGTYEQALPRVAPEQVIRGQNYGINDNQVEIENAVVQYNFGWADLVGTYSHIEGNSNYVQPAAIFGIGFIGPASFHHFTPHTENSGEIRLATKLDGPWNFLGGLYVDKQNDAEYTNWLWYGSPADNYFVAPGAPAEPHLLSYNDERDLTEKSAFAEVSWKFLPRFTLTGGVRAYDYKRSDLLVQSGPVIGPTASTSRENADATGTTFRANLSYKPSEATLLYAAWSQGFRLGRPQAPVPAGVCDKDSDGIIDGTNVSVASTSHVDSDNVDSYELGGKFAFLGHRLTLDTALFRMNWNKIPVLIGPPCNFSYTANAGTARSQGIEAQANLQVSRGFLVSVGGSWIDATLTQDVPAQGLLAGERLPGAAKQSANLGLQYSFNIAEHALSLRADSIYVGRYYSGFPLSDSASGDYVKVDVTVRTELGGLDLDLYARNLTNVEPFTSRSLAQGEFFGQRLRPRTVGFQLSHNF